MRYLLFVLLTLFLITSGSTPSKAESEKPITIAMTAAFVSEDGSAIYANITDYIESKIGLETDFLAGLSYSTVSAMVEAGATDVAFVCGYPYILAHDGKENPPMELLAAPVMEAPLYEDKPVYYSYIVTHEDSEAKSFADVKGQRFVYNDKTSNSGYNMPRAKLVEMGETQGFFGEVMHSGSHEESLRWVSESRADVSAIDSLVYDYALATGAPYMKNVKIIDKIGPAGIPPIVKSANLSDETAAKIQHVLLHMHEDPEGQAILKQAYVKKFVAVDDALFDGVRAWHKMAIEADFMEIK